MRSKLPNRPPFFNGSRNVTSKDLQERGAVEETWKYLRGLKYSDYLKTSTWKKIRERRLKKDSYKCVKCKSTENLHVHHKTYRHCRHEWMKDLITLCQPCHEKAHGTKFDKP